MSNDSRYLGSAKLIAVCTLLSRFTGLARDVVLNRHFGQNWVQDAFNYGFLIPNLFRRLFGEGALSAVFIPIFTETLDRKQRPAAWVLLGRVTALMVLVLSVLTILFELGLLAVHHFAAPDLMRGLQIKLTAVMLPFMLSVCVLALFSSILNCLNHFAAPALLPIVLNLCTILGVLWIGPSLGDRLDVHVYGVAISVVAAGVLQLLLILPVLRAHGVRIPLSLEHRDPDVRRILRMFLPVLLGQGVLLLNVFFDAQVCTFLTRGPDSAATFTIFHRELAYPLSQGALSAINNAQRLYQFPLGVLAISLATAAFPLFSLYASREDFVGLRGTLGQSLRVALFEGIPCALILVLLAEPIVTLLFQYGRYDAGDAARAAHALRWYAVGLPAYCCQHIIIRGFYSLKDTLTPMWISVALVAVNIALSLSLLWHPAIREAAFGISTSATATLHVLVSIWLLRRRMRGRIGARALVAGALKTLAAGTVLAACIYFVSQSVGGLALENLGRFGLRAVRVFLPLGAGAAAFILVARVLRCDELGWMLPRRSRAV